MCFTAAEDQKVTERVLPTVPVAKVVSMLSVSVYIHYLYLLAEPNVVGTVVRETEVGSGGEEEGEEGEAAKKRRMGEKLAIMMMPKRCRRLYEKVRLCPENGDVWIRIHHAFADHERTEEEGG